LTGEVEGKGGLGGRSVQPLNIEGNLKAETNMAKIRREKIERQL